MNVSKQQLKKNKPAGKHLSHLCVVPTHSARTQRHTQFFLPAQ
jgi:hypothetical protein